MSTKIEELLETFEREIFERRFKGRSHGNGKTVATMEDLAPYDRLSHFGTVNKHRTNIATIRSLGLESALAEISSLEELEILHGDAVSLRREKIALDAESRRATLRQSMGLPGSLDSSAPTVAPTPLEPETETFILSDVISKFSSEKEAGKLWRQKTKAENLGILNRFLGEVGDVPIAQITLQDIRKYKEAFDRNQFTPQTINKHLSRLRSFFESIAGSTVTSTPIQLAVFV